MSEKQESVIQWVEETYPEMTKEFKKIQQYQYELFCKKQADYGPGNIAMGTSLSTLEDKRLSLSALAVRVNDKTNRIINLLFKRQPEPANEPLIDSFDDLSVYGIIAQIVNRGKWGK